MKRILRPALCAVLALSASTICLLAQSPSPRPQGPPDGPPPGHHGPPPSPLFEALDTNHDGVLSADEIAAAPEVLKKLAGSAGEITRESLRPKHPGGPREQPDDQNGPDTRADRRQHHDERPDASPSDPDASPAPDRPPGRHHGPPPPDGNRPNASASPSASPSPATDEHGPGRHHGPPHGGPLFDALDTNHDGVISADEIANAAASLKTLDENGDGQLTREELRPPGPPPPRD